MEWASADGQCGWAVALRVTGIMFLASFVGIVSGAGSATTIGFVVAVIVMSGVLAGVAVQQYRVQAARVFPDR